ncbi:hypothetical protein K503DRAFT_792392 [Rhizopogon vinicolor AM-OR11-026]|uniref:Methyltransferase domain-containing protein n=1 Tax=Rhizopogon vinicolor AM-OR11-026 TaxID=1314800 RepID=A0A1B7N1D4_9AGAM|nr:hypothetical protein K503DRAFT_792392 [Rhizopogon vinicolor AM-OR11-026]
MRPEDGAFFKKVTGIGDDETLKQHILGVQAKVYQVAPYGSIYLLTFTRYLSCAIPYQQILRLGRERKNPIFLDVGCCFGNGIREAVDVGFPAEWAVGTDLHSELWDLGHELFKSSPETFPAKFVSGNFLDPKVLAVVPPASSKTAKAPDLSNLTSLNPLHGSVSVIHALAFFHLFNEAEQLHIARAFAGLLSAEPGSLIVGSNIGARVKGPVKQEFSGVEVNMFAHNLESWIALWDGELFEKGTVKVEAELRDGGAGSYRELMFWSVTRL